MPRRRTCLTLWCLTANVVAFGCGGQLGASRGDAGAGRDGSTSDGGRPANDASVHAGDAAPLGDAALPGHDASPADGGSGAPERVPGCGIAQEPGRRTLTFDVAGTQREVIMYVPQGYDSQTPLPLTFTLHGSTGTPAGQLDDTGIEPLADQKGFLVAAMAGYGGLWNASRDPSKPDDVRFAEVILDWAEANLCVDRARVFSTGYSGGARTSSRLACALPQRIRGIAPVAGVRHDAPCDVSDIAVLALHGTADQTNFYGGCSEADTACSRNGEWVESVEAAVNDWRGSNGCGEQPTVERLGDKVERRTWGDCASGSPVVFYKVTEGAHVWQLLPNTTEVVLDFFLAQPPR